MRHIPFDKTLDGWQLLLLALIDMGVIVAAVVLYAP